MYLTCELNVSWNDSLLLVISGSISSQFKNLSSKIFQNGSEVNWCSSSNLTNNYNRTTVALTLSANLPSLRCLWTLPTGNWSPARLDLLMDFSPFFPAPLPAAGFFPAGLLAGAFCALVGFSVAFSASDIVFAWRFVQKMVCKGENDIWGESEKSW